MRIRNKPTDNQTSFYLAELPKTPETVLSAGSSEKRIYRVDIKISLNVTSDERKVVIVMCGYNNNYCHFSRTFPFFLIKDLSPVNHSFNLNLKHLAFS